MLPRLLFGVAACSLVWFLVDRERRSQLVRRTYRLVDDGAGFDFISEVMVDEYAGYGIESTCQQVHDLASVCTTRRAHEVIAAGLASLRPTMPVPAMGV